MNKSKQAQAGQGITPCLPLLFLVPGFEKDGDIRSFFDLLHHTCWTTGRSYTWNGR